MSGDQDLRRRDRILLGILYGVPLIGNVNNFFTVLFALWPVPAGTSVRPMGLALWIGLVGVATPIVGVSAASIVPFLRRTSPLILWSSFICALLSCTPFFTGLFTYRFIVNHHHLIESK